jgi:hypothetical protein
LFQTEVQKKLVVSENEIGTTLPTRRIRNENGTTTKTSQGQHVQLGISVISGPTQVYGSMVVYGFECLIRVGYIYCTI